MRKMLVAVYSLLCDSYFKYCCFFSYVIYKKQFSAISTSNSGIKSLILYSIAFRIQSQLNGNKRAQGNGQRTNFLRAEMQELCNNAFKNKQLNVFFYIHLDILESFANFCKLELYLKCFGICSSVVGTWSISLSKCIQLRTACSTFWFVMTEGQFMWFV